MIGLIGIMCFQSSFTLACSVELPSKTYIGLSEINFDYDDGDYLEFFVNRPEDVDANLVSVIIDGKNVYEGQTLDKYNVIEKDLVSTTEQILIYYGNELIDGFCWKSEEVSKNEIEEVEAFESFGLGECFNSENIEDGTHVGRLNYLENDWILIVEDTPGDKNINDISEPEAKIEIQTGETVGYGEVAINLDGSSSLDPNGLDLEFKWDFGNGELSDKENPAAVSFDNVGNYVVELQVMNSLGKKDTTNLFVSVLPEISSSEGSADEIVTEEEVVEEVDDDFEDVAILDLKIVDFIANPEGSDTGNEWIRLRNISDVDGYGAGWVLDDSEGQSAEFDLSEVFFEAGQEVEIYNSLSGIGLNNSGDSVRLFKDGELVEEIKYENSESGQTYQMQISNLSEEIKEDTKELSEDEDLSEKNYMKYSDISISEILPNPEGKDSGNEWIELYNYGEGDLELNGWSIGLNNKTVKLDGMNVESSDYLVVEVTGFSNSGGTVEIIDGGGKVIQKLEYGKSIEGQSYADLGEWTWTKYISKSQANPIIKNDIGYIKELDIVNQLINISGADFIYDDLEGEFVVGDEVEYEYLEGELLKIAKIETEQKVPLGFIKDVESDETFNIFWVYILIYFLSGSIAFYFRKPIFAFMKTKLQGI